MNCGQPVGAPVPAPASTDDPTPDRLREYVPPEVLLGAEVSRGSAAPESERRRVTMLFCDVKGSTAVAERLDPEEWAEIMNGAFAHLSGPIYRYDGTLARLMGDAILAFFGAPVAHEDDPERAVLAGLEIVREIAPYRERVRREWNLDFDVRVGINTGLVVMGAVGSELRVDYTAMGDAVNVAARMEQTAEPGTVHISGATHDLVERLFEFVDLGTIEVKNRAEPVRTYRPTRVLPRPATLRGIEGLRSPMVGRDAERARLTDAFEGLLTGRGRIISVMGEAGLGKSRLVADLREHLGETGRIEAVRWVEGRSLSYEQAIPYAPVASILRSLAGLPADCSDDDAWRAVESMAQVATPGRAAQTAALLGSLLVARLPEHAAERVSYLPPAQLQHEVVRAVCDTIAGLAEGQPIVLVFEDLHWADSGTIEVVRALQHDVARAPLLLVQIFRPGRSDPSWPLHEEATREHPHLYDSITLSALDTDDARRLVSSLLAIDGLPDTVRDLILQKADGNPYFVEEVVRSLIDHGQIAHDGERWNATGAIMDVRIPDTLAAVLTTRLDQLGNTARGVAQAASVLGREFYYDEVANLVSDLSELDTALQELQRREMLRETARIPRRQFQFKHALLQDAAYETILLRRRVELHGAAADLLERLQPERVSDIARHFVQSRQHQRAVPYLIESAARAGRAYATDEAIRAIEEALTFLGEDGDTVLTRRALETLGAALESRYDAGGARAIYERLRRDGQRRGDLAMRLSGLNKLAFLRGMFFGEREEALHDLAESEELARAAAEKTGLAESCMVQCYLRTGQAEFDDVQRYMHEVAALGDELEEGATALFGMTHLANTLVYLTHFDEALPQAQRALARAEALGHAKFQAELLTFAIPFCHLRNGAADEAIEALSRGMEIALRIGDRASEQLGATLQGKLAMAGGAYEDALALFRRGLAASDAAGMPYLRALARCEVGTCYEQIGGRMLTQALAYHVEAEALTKQPTGTIMGTWILSEFGACALSAGQVDAARAYYDSALRERSAPMHLMRPAALSGACVVALAEGRLDDAERLFSELDAYVSERGMKHEVPTALLVGANVDAAAGRLDSSLRRLDDCEAMVEAAGMRRPHLEVLGTRARVLSLAGRDAEAAIARAGARRIADTIASDFSDPDLRAAFLEGAYSRLGLG